MKKLLLPFALVALSSTAYAGVLQGQWTEGTTRFCSYSDGEVVAISFGSICSATN